MISLNKAIDYQRSGTHDGREKLGDGFPDHPVAPDKDWIRRAVHIAPCVDTEVMHGTNHVVELTEERAPHDGEDHCAYKRADETFHCFLWRELDERGAAHGNPTDVRKDVIADDEGRGDEEPDEALQKVVYDEVAENQVRQSPNSPVHIILPRDDNE